MRTTKILSLLMAVILLLGVLTLGVAAETTDQVYQQLNLGDDLDMQFYVPADANTVINVTVGENKTAYDLSGKTPDSNGRYVATASLAAAQMTAPITLEFVQGGANVKNTYTVRDYVLTILNGEYPAFTKTLAQHMLNYGAAAQAYFDVDDKNPANAGQELTYTAQLPSQYETAEINGQISGVSFYGASLVFESQIAVRYYFAADSVEGVTFTANGNTYTAEKKNNMYYVEVPSINPQEYSESIVLSAVKGEETLSVSYCPLNYIVRMSKKGSDSLKTLLNAMYGYHEAAVAYVENSSAFERNYDATLWDLSKEDQGIVTVIGGGGATAQPLQFKGQYQNMDLTINARDYADASTKSRTDVEFVFENGQTVTFGIAEGNRIQTRAGTLLSWKTPYDLNAAEKAQLEIDADEIAAGKEDGLDLRIVRYGTVIYLFIENKQVAICDLTKCANTNGDTESGVTADTKMSVYLRHYDDVREGGVEIPFSITTDVKPVVLNDSTAERGTVTGNAINYYVNNARVSKYSDTHFMGEKVTLTARPEKGNRFVSFTVDGQNVDGATYAFTASKDSYDLCAVFEELVIFENNYDTGLWDLSGQYDGYVTVIGGGGATNKPLQFVGSYQNVDLTLNAKDYAEVSTKSRTEFGFEFDVDGDGVIDTAKGDQTVTFGIAEGDRIQTRAGTLLSWKAPYDLNTAEKAQLKIDADEIAAGNEDGLDLRVIRYGTTIYLFVENKQVAVCDLTKCANTNGDTESGITADTKMFIYLRHYDDLREDGVQIPFSITTDVKPVVLNDSTAERGTVTGNTINYYVNNARVSKYSDTHFKGEKVTLTARPEKGNRFVSFTVDGKNVDGTTYAFTASKDSYDICAVFEEIVIFENNYDTGLWDLSGQYDGYVTVIGGGGATNKPLQFVGSYQNVDLTLNARDYAEVSTQSRTEFGFEFDVDGDGKIDTAKGDQTVTFGIAQGDRIQTRAGTLLSWKTPYDLNAAEKAQLTIDADEIAAGNEDGLDLRVVRYGTTIYLFIENKQVAVCDLTKCANAAGDTESGITADTKMFIYLRHYDDLREAGVQIPFSIKTDVTPVELSVTAGENGTAHAGYVNCYVNNGRISKLSDTHFVGEKVTLTATPASEELVCAQMLVGGNDQTGSMTVNTAGVGTYTFTAGAKAYNVEFAFGAPVFENTFNTAVWNVAQQCQGVVTLPAGGGGTGNPLLFKGTYTDVDVSLVARDYADAESAARTDLEFIFDNGETVTFGVVCDSGSYRIQNRGGTLLSWKTPYFITDQALIDAYVVTAEEMKSGNPGGLNFRVVRYGTEFYLYLNDQMVKGYDFSYDIAADTTVTVYLRHYDDAGVKVEIPFAITEDVTIEDLRLFTEKEPVTDYAYTFAVVPDTQIVAENDVVNGETNMAKLYDWIVANKESKNIQFVFGLGDVTDNNNEAEWTLAQAQHQKLLDAGIPYSVVRGNHDLSWYGKDKEAENYTVDDFTNYMGTTAYRAQFGGFYSEDNIANSWRTLEIGDMKYLLITLDWGAKDAILNWASSIIYQHPDHNVIITTHAYLFRDGTTLDGEDLVPPSANGGVNDGDDMWEKLVSKHENIVLVMSGHDPQENIIVNRSTGDNGNTVNAMLIDAQDAEAQEGSMGMVALLHFSADGKTVQVEYYSTAKEKYFKAENQFTLELDVAEEAQSGTVPATGAYTNNALTEGSAYTTTIADEQRITLSEKPYTVSAWINVPKSIRASAGAILGNYINNDSANCLNIEITNNGNPRFYFRNAGNYSSSLVFNNVDVRSDTQWVHLVLVASGNRVSCYVNGELKQTLVAESTIQLEDTNSDFIIGGDLRTGNARAFQGKILKLDLYSGILSAEKIQSLYENGSDAVTEGKIEY